MFGAEESLYTDGRPKLGPEVIMQLAVGENYYLTRGTIRKMLNTTSSEKKMRANLSRIKGVSLSGTNVFYCYYLTRGFKEIIKDIEREIVEKTELMLRDDLSRKMYEDRKSAKQIAEAITFCKSEQDVYDILHKFPSFRSVYTDNHIYPLNDEDLKTMINVLSVPEYKKRLYDMHGHNLLTMSSREIMSVLRNLQKGNRTTVSCFPGQIKIPLQDIKTPSYRKSDRQAGVS